MEIEAISVLRNFNVTFYLMQVLAVSFRISQHVGEQNNENCRIAQPEPWHIVPGNCQTSEFIFKRIIHFLLVSSFVIEVFLFFHLICVTIFKLKSEA